MLVCPFAFVQFCFRTNLIKFGVLIFCGRFRKAGNFTPGRYKAEKLADSGKKNYPICFRRTVFRAQTKFFHYLFHYMYIGVYLLKLTSD